MKITQMLREEFILPELKARGKRDSLAEMVGMFAKSGVGADPEAMLRVLMEREKLGSTGIGDGLAIPHGKLAGLDEMVIAFARSRKGIEFDAMDGKPVHLIVLLIAPENSAGQHLKALAKISRMMKDEGYRRALLEAKTHGDLVRIIGDKDDET